MLPVGLSDGIPHSYPISPKSQQAKYHEEKCSQVKTLREISGAAEATGGCRVCVEKNADQQGNKTSSQEQEDIMEERGRKGESHQD